MSELPAEDEAHIRAATTAVMRGVRHVLRVVPSHIATNIAMSITMSCATSLACWMAARHPEHVAQTRAKLLANYDLGLLGGGEPLDDAAEAGQAGAGLH